jgi:hypothetical protein
MGHLRTVRNGMFNRGQSIRGIRATTRRRFLIKVLPWGKKIWGHATVRVRNMTCIGISQGKPVPYNKALVQYAKALRKRFSKVYLERRGN